jgi:DNA-binding FadR family transcriptional regulator
VAAASTTLPLNSRTGQQKLAAQVASRIVDDVVARGWPVGEVLGSSNDFLERYDISRAVFREAVRLLEHQQVARTRRGPGGGLVVTEPSVDAITDAAILYLHRVGARLDEVLEARLVLEEIETELSGNPALDLVVDILDRARALYGRRQTLPIPPERPDQKLAEGVAREIFQGVVADRLEPGHLLGSEPELTERYGVSRAVFREAVRLLEHHQVAAMRRGPGGGLFVSVPTSAAVAEVLAIYLARHGAGISAVADLRVRLEVALVDLVIDRLDEEGAATLEESVEVEEGDDEAEVTIHNLHAHLAHLTGNRALELISLMLIRLTRFHQRRGISTKEAAAIRDEVNRTHVNIARAIQASDRELARKRVQRHLEVLTTHLR